MTIRDFTSTRVYLDASLAPGERVTLDKGQANYLVNVLRLGDGEELLVFNGRDGEWRGRLVSIGRRQWLVEALLQTRPQPAAPDLDYLFAPLKQARHDYMVQKAVEMGAGRLRPVLTQHGQVSRLNLDRLEANVIEAAEQCGILSIPAIDEPRGLAVLLSTWEKQEGGRRIVFCDEAEPEARSDPLTTLERMGPGPLAVLIGPEGGFSAEERADLRSRPFVTALSLGPRILRADTAAVAALAIVQAVLGDWRNGAGARKPSP